MGTVFGNRCEPAGAFPALLMTSARVARIEVRNAPRTVLAATVHCARTR